MKIFKSLINWFTNNDLPAIRFSWDGKSIRVSRICKICEQGRLTEHTEDTGIVYSVCDSCGSEQCDHRQAKRNKKWMLERVAELEQKNTL